jgi:GNAT superfamily N-acetyltransferase
LQDEITIRVSTSNDLEFLYNLLKVALGPHVERVYGPWNDEVERAKFFESTQPGSHQIVERAGDPIGCLKIRRMPEEFRLDRVFLLPAFQNLGIGKRLIDQVVSEAKAAGLPVRLRVFRINPARYLYERLGFVVTVVTKTHIHMEKVT